MQFGIAGLTVSSTLPVPFWRDFQLQTPTEKQDIAVFWSHQQRDLTNAELLTDAWRVQVWRLQTGEWVFTNRDFPAAGQTVVSPDYRLVEVCTPEETMNPERVGAVFLKFALELSLAMRATLSFHAACIEVDHTALCFTGDSGMGKSTRANAWIHAVGAEFISGDRPAIRLEADGAVACGVPWDGKEQIFRNVERPLKAILEVRRAPFTRLRRLSAEQAFRVCVCQSSIPMWDTDAAAAAMGNVRALCRTVPVYRLFCGPEVADAQAVYDVLFRHPEQLLEDQPDMKRKEGFALRHVVDEYLLMPTGANIKKFAGAVVLNEVSAFIWEQLQRPVSKDDLVELIAAEFEADVETIRRDLDKLLEQLRTMELLEE